MKDKLFSDMSHGPFGVSKSFAFLRTPLEAERTGFITVKTPDITWEPHYFRRVVLET